MHKGQISFAFAGLLFGFLVGFVVAHQIYAGRGGAGFTHPPVPQGASMPPPSAPARPPAGGQAGNPESTMQAVQQEIASLRDLLSKEPENAPALIRLGNLFFDAGMYDGAVEHYEHALRLDPGNVDVQTDLGTCFRNTGQPEKAMEHFRAAVQQAPEHWKGWFNIGVVSLYDLGDFEQAQAAFDRVAELRPGSVDMAALSQEIDRVRAERAAQGGSL